jgi:hypothetical protein
MKNKFLARRSIILSVTLLWVCSNFGVMYSSAANQKDKTITQENHQNTCGTSDAACSNTVRYICECVGCTPTPTVECPCVQKTGSVWEEKYSGSCVEISAGAEVSFPSFSVNVGGKWYACNVSDPTSGKYVTHKICGRDTAG